MRYRALAVLPALVWPGVAAAKFAPVEGVSYVYAIMDTREAGRFTSERRIVFRRADTGWTAELTVISADAVGTGNAATMSRGLLSALIGQHIRYRLDAQGAVVAVEDQDALIKRVGDAIGTAPGKSSTAARDAVADRMAKTLAALTPDAQRTLLASLLTPAIGGALADDPIGERPIAMPAGSAFGPGGTELIGTQVVTRGDVRTVIDTVAEGPSPGGAMTRIVQHREIDTATGIVMRNERRTETWLTATPDKRQVATSSATVAF